MRAYGTIEDARQSLIDHIEVLFPLPSNHIIMLYRDVFGLYRIRYIDRSAEIPMLCDEIIEYASNQERENNEQTSKS